ncbi:MAG: hypothetical protein R2764_12675 [Bacteroidales bacterium]
MKFRIIKVAGFTILAVAISLWVFASRSDSDELRRDLLLKVITFAINSGHYHPGEIDNGFSEKAFDFYIDNIDYAKRFLLKEDVDRMAKYRNELDDAFLNIDFEFLDLSTSILDKRTLEAKDYYTDILSHPFDFSVDEKYEYDVDKIDFAKNQKELKERWRLSLKSEILSRIYDEMKDQEKAAEKIDTVTIKSFDEIEVMPGKSFKRYDDWFHRMSKFDDNDRLNTYVNSLLNVFDPHTQYFPPKQKEDFDIRFSGQLEGIGAHHTKKCIC